jgi:hypothetical protein
VKYIENQGIGTYTLTLPTTAKFGYKSILDVLPRRYCIDRMLMNIEGDVARDDKG